MTDFTRYVFRTNEPDTIARFVGRKIQGMTPGFGYYIESFDGQKKGIAVALRESVAPERCACCGIIANSIRNLPLYFVDFEDVK